MSGVSGRTRTVVHRGRHRRGASIAPPITRREGRAPDRSHAAGSRKADGRSASLRPADGCGLPAGGGQPAPVGCLSPDCRPLSPPDPTTGTRSPGLSALPDLVATARLIGLAVIPSAARGPRERSDLDGQGDQARTWPRSGRAFLGSPDRAQPCRVKPVQSPLTRPDHNVIKDGGHDGPLTGQRKAGPPLT